MDVSESLGPVGYDRVGNVRITSAIICGTRLARALRVPVRVPDGQEASKARDRPDRQVHRVVLRRDGTLQLNMFIPQAFHVTSPECVLERPQESSTSPRHRRGIDGSACQSAPVPRLCRQLGMDDKRVGLQGALRRFGRVPHQGQVQRA